MRLDALDMRYRRRPIPLPLSNRRRTHAFTLVELIVVIAIIALLIGIAVFGMKHIFKGQGTNTTAVQLQSLRGLIAELETTGKLSSRQPPFMWSGGTRVGPPDETIDIWSSGAPTVSSSDPTAGSPSPLNSPGDVTIEAWDSGDPKLSDRFRSDAVANTQLVMRQLMANPNNRAAVGKLPPDQLLKNPEQGMTPPKHPIITAQDNKLHLENPANASGTITPPIPVDAWQNPIIFVPSAGLRVAVGWSGMDTYKAGALVVDSNKLYRAIKANHGTPTSDTGVWEQYTGPGVVTSPDHRPFFASAGPDGDFRTPDDNIYSFQQ
jgi:prepilin-type N-terminal cleavage/methylation domain-containing protein